MRTATTWSGKCWIKWSITFIEWFQLFIKQIELRYNLSTTTAQVQMQVRTQTSVRPAEIRLSLFLVFTVSHVSVQRFLLIQMFPENGSLKQTDWARRDHQRRTHSVLQRTGEGLWSVIYILDWDSSSVFGFELQFDIFGNSLILFLRVQINVPPVSL